MRTKICVMPVTSEFDRPLRACTRESWTGERPPPYDGGKLPCVFRNAISGITPLMRRMSRFGRAAIVAAAISSVLTFSTAPAHAKLWDVLGAVGGAALAVGGGIVTVAVIGAG